MEDDELERDYLEFKKLLDAGDIEGVAQIVADYIFILITNPGKSIFRSRLILQSF